MHSTPQKNLVLVALMAVILAACSGPITATVQPATEIPVGVSAVSFSQDVLPILRASCVSCHGSTRQRAGLMLNTYEVMMTGASGEAVIIPNDAAASVLVQVITSGEMPKDDTKLSDAEVQLISDWINAGALDN